MLRSRRMMVAMAALLVIAVGISAFGGNRSVWNARSLGFRTGWSNSERYNNGNNAINSMARNRYSRDTSLTTTQHRRNIAQEIDDRDDWDRYRLISFPSGGVGVPTPSQIYRNHTSSMSRSQRRRYVRNYTNAMKSTLPGVTEDI